MSSLGNILWLIFGGFLATLGYFIGGLILCITIIGIPFGVQAFNLGKAVFMPFGKQVITKPGGQGCLPLFFGVLWFLLFGWEIALVHLIAGAILCVTVIGIPFGLQHFKLIPVALLPLTYSLE